MLGLGSGLGARIRAKITEPTEGMHVENVHSATAQCVHMGQCARPGRVPSKGKADSYSLLSLMQRPCKHSQAAYSG